MAPVEPPPPSPPAAEVPTRSCPENGNLLTEAAEIRPEPRNVETLVLLLVVVLTGSAKPIWSSMAAAAGWPIAASPCRDHGWCWPIPAAPRRSCRRERNRLV